MEKKFDLHVHSNYSIDSLSSPKDIVKKYHSLGFHGFAITDHNRFGAHLAAQEYARANNIEMEIIGACEFKSSIGEVIGLFINEMIESTDFGSLCDAIHDQGGFVILPHPFDSLRKGATFPDKFSSEILRLVDGVEVLNAHAIKKSDNERALSFAKEKNLSMTGASDAHFIFECGAAYTSVPDDIPLDIALRKSATSASGKELPFYVHGFPTLIKWAKKSKIIKSY
jgi:hypothetical protein